MTHKHFSILTFVLAGVLMFLFSSMKMADATLMPEMEEDTKPLKKLTNSDSELLAFKPIDSMMNRVMTGLRLTGATVAIVKDERLVYAKGFGFADKEQQEIVEPYHRFRIGSISKLITATAVLKLVDEGKIGLDDYVFGDGGILKGDSYDVIQNRNIYQIRVKHLLNHTSGWSLITYGDPMFIPHRIHKMDKVDYPIGFDDVTRFVLKRHLPYRPGRRYNYSNFGYVLLGEVVAAVTGTTYENWVRKNVLEPNGIYDMALAGNLEKDRQELEVKYYDYSPDNQQLAYNGTGEMAYKPYGADDIRMLGPAGGWLATSVDLMKFLVLVDGYSNRYKDILSAELMDKMVNGVDGVQRPLGWRSVKDEHWWRTGTLSGTSALLTRDTNGYSWVVISNTTPRRGSFPGTSRWAMREALAKVNQWPDRNLFDKFE